MTATDDARALADQVLRSVSPNRPGMVTHGTTGSLFGDHGKALHELANAVRVLADEVDRLRTTKEMARNEHTHRKH